MDHRPATGPALPGLGERNLQDKALHDERIEAMDRLEGVPEPLPRGRLRGAAAPFIRRWPAPDEDWDEAVAQAAAEDWRAKLVDEEAENL
jgi:hypothetical protein